MYVHKYVSVSDTKSNQSEEIFTIKNKIKKTKSVKCENELRSTKCE